MEFISEERFKKLEEINDKKWLGRSTYWRGYNLVMFTCIRCHSHYLLSNCENCSQESFELASSGGQDGIFCTVCQKGFMYWQCPKCEAENPSARTFLLLQEEKEESSGGCFIATAVYNSPTAPKVIALKEFRDKKLLTNSLGERFVQFYYRNSPPIANFLSRHKFLSEVVRVGFVEPLVWVVQIFRK